jgi:preprotein translocase subunit YajC
MSDKCPDKNPPEIEIEIEKDIEKEIEIEKENIKEKAQSKKPEVENPRVDNQLLNDKKGRKKETLKKYDEVLTESGLSEKIIKNLKDFIQMRTLIKKPMTNRALELCINDLKKLSNDEETQVKIIEQSIKRNWQGLYPLKEQKNDNKDSTNVFKNLFEEEGNIWREQTY